MATKTETKKMLLTINLLTIAIVLDLVVSAIPGLNLSMPFGGKFFGLSMLPLVLIGLFYGVKYGLIAGFIYALYNFGFDYVIYIDTLRVTLESWTGESWSALKILLLILLDYVIPFTSFGLSGLFKGALRSQIKLIVSMISVSIVRLISSTLAGVILWSSSISYAMEQVESGEPHNLATRIFSGVGQSIWLYSFSYNVIYIASTTIIVTLISIVIRRRLLTLIEPISINNL